MSTLSKAAAAVVAAYDTEFADPTIKALKEELNNLPYTVTFSHDDSPECPSDWGGWKLYSFNRRHSTFKHPRDLGLGEILEGCDTPEVEDEELAAKLASGLAFFLSYYEHGQSLWMVYGDSRPGVEWQWDGTRIAGLLVWDQPEDNIGSKTYAERRNDAENFVNTYTAWMNGEVYGFIVEDEHEEIVDSCGGFYCGNKDSQDYFLDQVREAIGGHSYTVVGDADFLAHREDLSKKHA